MLITIYVHSTFIYSKYSSGALKEKSIQLSKQAIIKACPFKDLIYKLIKLSLVWLNFLIKLHSWNFMIISFPNKATVKLELQFFFPNQREVSSWHLVTKINLSGKQYNLKINVNTVNSKGSHPYWVIFSPQSIRAKWKRNNLLKIISNSLQAAEIECVFRL